MQQIFVSVPLQLYERGAYKAKMFQLQECASVQRLPQLLLVSVGIPLAHVPQPLLQLLLDAHCRTC
jgi:hypothetical protein